MPHNPLPIDSVYTSRLNGHESAYGFLRWLGWQLSNRAENKEGHSSCSSVRRPRVFRLQRRVPPATNWASK